MGNKSIKNVYTKKLTITGIMTALVFVITLFVKIPLGVNGAYWNAGDVIIYMSAYILGGPLTAFAAGVGSCLADLAGGAPLYIVPTLIIKALMGFIAGKIDMRQSILFYFLASVAAGAVMASGYTLYEYLLFGQSVITITIPFNIIQWLGGVGIAMLFYPAARMISSYYKFNN